MNEIAPLNRFLRAALRGDATIAGAVGARVYIAIAPPKDPATGAAPAFPYLTVWNLARRALIIPGGEAPCGLATYGVKAVGTSEDALEEIATAITAVLEAATGTESGVHVLSITRDPTGLPQLVEVVDGRRIVHIGDRFLIHWEAA